MTKAELVADLLAKGADESEITQIKNTSEKELVEAGLIEGKQIDVASKGADVTSENTAPENTELESEDISSDLENTVDLSPAALGTSLVETEGTEEKVDPYEDFYIKPNFFGELTTTIMLFGFSAFLTSKS